MSQVVREDIDNLNAVLTVTIAQDEYEPKFKQQWMFFVKLMSLESEGLDGHPYQVWWKDSATI